MMYSCALWGDEEGGANGDLVSGLTHGDMEAAQMRKINHVLRQLRLRPGHRLLEFGTGWGALAIEVNIMVFCACLSLTFGNRRRAHMIVK